MNTGMLHRVFSEQMPETYDRETRVVSMDIQPEQSTDIHGNAVDGYSFCQVQIDGVIDYGNIKSQLIEAAFPPKDEIAIVANALRSTMNALSESSSFTSFKNTLSSNDDIAKLNEFNEYRRMCANTALTVWRMYNHTTL